MVRNDFRCGRSKTKNGIRDSSDVKGQAHIFGKTGFFFAFPVGWVPLIEFAL